ncbi:MAG: HAD family phosphatase [Erysipelotrichales bacterium]|nr:HAD family phosphatase [Erysipelotrichales bacterium]
MKRKYFFFDIDGTITVRETGEPVPSAVRAIHKVEEAGHFVAIATGRAQYKARPFMERIGMKNMVCNGGAGIVVDSVLVDNKPLDLERSKIVARQAEALGYGILFAIDDSIRVYAKDDLFIRQCGERKEPTEYHFDPDFDFEKLLEIYKMYVSIPMEKEEELTSRKDLGHLRFVKEYLMFQHDDKKAGILRMMEYLHGDPKEVVVFGDDTNDLVMFDPMWTSVAMGNGSQELKNRADYIAPKNVDDGIWKTMEHFGWFERVTE